MGRAAARYHALGAEHAIRQRKLEEKDVAILEKEAAIFEKEKEIARDQKRPLEVFCAFSCSNNTTNREPIRGTIRIEIDQALYDRCLDRSNYRGRG